MSPVIFPSSLLLFFDRLWIPEPGAKLLLRRLYMYGGLYIDIASDLSNYRRIFRYLHIQTCIIHIISTLVRIYMWNYEYLYARGRGFTMLLTINVLITLKYS